MVTTEVEAPASFSLLQSSRVHFRLQHHHAIGKLKRRGGSVDNSRNNEHLLFQEIKFKIEIKYIQPGKMNLHSKIYDLTALTSTIQLQYKLTFLYNNGINTISTVTIIMQQSQIITLPWFSSHA